VNDDSGALPRNVVVVLLDSLNRHLIGPYGSTEFATPNLDRFALRSTLFTNHHSGSLPCMPARHDLLCGAQDFLWRPWGSIEVWEDAITYELRRGSGLPRSRRPPRRFRAATTSHARGSRTSLNSRDLEP
jgi:arylsulfatase A-like enzyme